MLKKIILVVVFALTYTTTHAQTADQIFDYYLEMDMARTKGEPARGVVFGETILPNVDKLPAKYKLPFYYSLAKVYDDNSQGEKAIKYYEIVLAAKPNYFVPHRALGYIYFDMANEIAKKMQTAKGDDKLLAQYKATIRKALPHLEKAQACDPSDETLDLIKKLYAGIKDTASLSSLQSRLTALSKNCVDVLTE